jgi:hypothetical protein
MILAPISWIDDFLWMPLWPSKTKIIDSKFSNENCKKVKSIHEQRELMLDSSNYNNKKNLSKSTYILLSNFKWKQEYWKFDTGMPLQWKIGNNTGNFESFGLRANLIVGKVWKYVYS